MKRIVMVIFIVALATLSAGAYTDLFQQSWDLNWRGDHQGAVRGYLEFAKANSKHELAPVAMYNAASINFLELNDFDAARDGFLELVQEHPATKWTAEAYSCLARIALADENPRQAVDYYRQALKLSSGDNYSLPDTWIDEVLQNFRDNLTDLNDPEFTLNVYRDIAAFIPPGNQAAEAKYNLGMVLKETDRNEEAASAFIELLYFYPYSGFSGTVIENERELIDQHHDFPWNAVETMREGIALYRQRQYSQARDIFKGVSEEFHDTPLVENAELSLIGAEIHITGDFETGAEMLQDYIDKYPDGVGSSEASDRLEETERILRMMDRLAVNPDDYPTHVSLGFQLLRRGFFGKAADHFEAATVDTTSDAAYMGLGYAYLNSGRTEDGIKAFERYLQSSPNDGNAYNRIGYAYLGLGQMDEALTCFQRYVELEPDNPNSHDSYAECLMNLERYEEAITQYQRAIELNPGFTNPYFMLGEVYNRMGDEENALRYYRQYLEQDPNGFQSVQAQANISSLSQN
ncbi:hypothetical protein CEE37_03480 [candidate division LCP-89 bacterium B3_LCP]|uniref:Outer membrane lipoprotein BamD-like domain-containing protein n=1 Tax=candidate division LCP-89 bacterium B3_LCP TaxID=2012998 RepID=A0A532V348_UNCL8|nr:MAG: hypothetical protein CEE37_03480 [candidate division LCP-89 bacterium B3_LCP]